MLNEVVHVVLDEPRFDSAFEGLECLNLAIPCDFWAKSATIFCFVGTCGWCLEYWCWICGDGAFVVVEVKHLF